jgi:hypothetical protein
VDEIACDLRVNEPRDALHHQLPPRSPHLMLRDGKSKHSLRNEDVTVTPVFFGRPFPWTTPR